MISGWRHINSICDLIQILERWLREGVLLSVKAENWFVRYAYVPAPKFFDEFVKSYREIETIDLNHRVVLIQLFSVSTVKAPSGYWFIPSYHI